MISFADTEKLEMKVAAIYDEDLEFLRRLTNEQLDPLVKLLVYDNDQKKRYSEQLSTNEIVKAAWPRHTCYINEIIEEIQRYGANTIVTIFRGGKGVKYKEVLFDVCEKLKIKNIKNKTTEELEKLLLLGAVEKAVKKMTEAERINFIKNMKINTNHIYTAEAIIMALQLSFGSAFVVSAAALQFILDAAFVSSMTTFLGTTIFTTSAGTYMAGGALAVLTGPLGLMLSGSILATSIAGPAYRVTVPVCLTIAYLRNKIKAGDDATISSHTNFCPNCGHKRNNDEKFCPECGNKFL